MNIHAFLRTLSRLAPALAALCLSVACTEDIDMSNRYTFTEETMLSYLQKQPQYSQYVNLLDYVPVSSVSQSTIAQLLSARGHYTCFAPNNEAIQLYLDSLQRKGIIPQASWDTFPSEKVLDSIRKVIVYNSIIDGGDYITYETGTFPLRDNEEFALANMNDRKLSVIRAKHNSDSIFINGEALVSMKNRDIEVINGRVHEVENVIAPSNDTMRDMLQKWANGQGSGYSVTAKLILACGLADTLAAVRDETWEELYQTGQVKDLPNHTSFGQAGSLPQHRKYGFTLFAETDSLWQQLLGKEAKDITVADVKQYLISSGAFTDEGTTTDDQFDSKDNILNQFVTYHLLPFKMSHERLVVHWNELGFNKNSPRSNYTIPVYEYYTSMGRRRLLKTYESFESHGIYLNRFPILRNGRGRYSVEHENRNDYHESGFFQDLHGHSLRADENEGIKVLSPSDAGTSGETILNGIVYPIQHLLVCTENVRTQMMNQRIRIDVCAMFPEFTNNNQRDLRDYVESFYWGYPNNYSYFNDIDIKDGCRFYFLTGYGYNWRNYQGTELNITGRYEFTMKLPPVPKEGHYEIRFSVQVVSNRGMCQIYFGDDPNNMPATGIPLDMRMAGQHLYLKSGTLQNVSPVGWEPDTDDPSFNDQIDKQMRANGFMKAPNCFSEQYGASTSCRSDQQVLRRIVVSQYMYPEKTYYIKFKNVLDAEYAECFMDYLEWCSKEVYDNPEESEDIW